MTVHTLKTAAIERGSRMLRTALGADIAAWLDEERVLSGSGGVQPPAAATATTTTTGKSAAGGAKSDGGEMSAHHYFREFYYCDSGMVPWLLVAELIGTQGKPLSAQVEARIDRFPASGEINRRVDDAQAVMDRIWAQYEPDSVTSDTVDGISVAFDDWRFNLRASNTEPVIRLNVESRGDITLVRNKTEELLGRIGGDAA